MFRLEKKFRFEAAHRLPNHDGKCQRLHGHSWVGSLIVQGGLLIEGGPKAGMLMDFGDLKRIMDPIVEQYLDHHYLNDTLELENPTSEEIARWILNRAKETCKRYDIRSNGSLVGVRIEETCTSAAEYWG